MKTKFLIIIYVIFLAPFLGYADNYDSSDEAKILKIHAEQINQLLPQDAGDGVILYRVIAGPGRIFTYHYICTNVAPGSVNKIIYEVVMTKILKNNMDQSFIEYLQALDAHANFNYYYKSGELIGSVRLTKDDF